MTQYIGFFTNRSTKDEFVAPVEAEDRAEARMALDEAYPAAFYTLLTIYARSELNTALASVDRWPGLPSKMQKPVADSKFSHVTAQTGGLPPLTRSQPKAALPAADGGTVKAITEAAAKSQTSEMQALALRLASALSGAQTPAPEVRAPASARGRSTTEDATASLPQTSALAALKALHSGKEASMAAQAYAAPAAPSIPSAPHKGTLIDVLKAMRNG